jgi:HK97 gp10 family phage protein
MSQFVGIKVQGLDSLLKKMEGLRKEVEDRVDEEMDLLVEDIEADAKSLVPVDLGALKSSIRPAANERLHKEIIVGERYAPYLEFGTGKFVEVPSGLEDYAMTWYVNGKGYIHPHPFLFPAVEKNRKPFIENLKKSLKNL